MTRLNSKRLMVSVVAACALGGIGAAHAQQTIRVGWTIPAEESKYWMMRRPAQFPNLGKTYTIEWTQFQGTSPMTQALAAGGPGWATQGPRSLAQAVGGGHTKGPILGPPPSQKTPR